MPRRLGTADTDRDTTPTHVTVPLWLLVISAAIPVTLILSVLLRKNSR